MTEENQDLAPEEPSEEAAPTQAKGRRAFKNVPREFSDEELSSPAVHRFLINDIDRLEQDNVDLSGFQEEYYKADKKAAVLTEKLKANVAQDVAFGVFLTVGAALMSFAVPLWVHQPFGLVSLSIGSILVIGGIICKVVRR